MQFLVRCLHQKVSIFYSAAGLQSECKFSYLGNYYFLQLFKLLCFLRWARLAILASKDKCKSLQSYYCSDFTDLENFRCFWDDCVWLLERLTDFLIKSKSLVLNSYLLERAVFSKGYRKAGERNSAYFFCMQESFCLESGEERIAASEGLTCDAQKNLCKINHTV